MKAPQMPALDKFEDVINLFADPKRLRRHFEELREWYAKLDALLASVGVAEEIEGLRAQARAQLDEAAAVRAKADTDADTIRTEAITARDGLLAEGTTLIAQGRAAVAEAATIREEGQRLARAGQQARDGAEEDARTARRALAEAQAREREAAILKADYESKLADIAAVVRR